MTASARAHRRDRSIVLSIVGLLLAVVGFFWLHGRLGDDQDGTAPPIPVAVVRPEQRTLGERLVLSSILESETTVAVVPRVGGILLDILAEEGDRAAAGDLLARVDAEPYRLDLQAAEAAYLLAENRLERTRRLHESAAVSLQNLDEAQAARDAAFSDVEAARMRRDYADIRAPVSGTVLLRYADAGNMASTDTPLFSIGDPSRLQVRLRVSEKYWDDFADAGNLPVRVRRPDGDPADIRPARIDRVAPGIDPVSRTFGVTCSVDPGAPPWPVGARLTVEVVLEERSGAWSLPREALTGTGSVWEVAEGGDVRELSLDGAFRDELRVEVPADFAGRAFVLHGHHRLSEGRRVAAYEDGA